MASKRLTVGGAIALCVSAFGLLFRESVGWIVGKTLDRLPLPRGAGGAVNWDAIPWLNMLAFAMLALGVYLFYRGGRIQAKSAPDPSFDLASAAYRTAHAIEMYRSTRSLLRSRLPDLIPIAREGIATIISFQKAGYGVPRLASKDAGKIAVGVQHYLGTMAPLLNEGHSDVAMRDAEKIAQAADNLCDNLQPEQFWTSNEW